MKFTPAKLKQLRFWIEFKNYAEGKTIDLVFRKPYPQNWLDINFGVPNILISCKLETRKKELHCEIDMPDNVSAYNNFFVNKIEIEQKFGEDLRWIDAEKRFVKGVEKAKKVRRIRVSISRFYIDEIDNWEYYFKWLLKKINKFQKVFVKDGEI